MRFYVLLVYHVTSPSTCGPSLASASYTWCGPGMRLVTLVAQLHVDNQNILRIVTQLHVDNQNIINILRMEEVTWKVLSKPSTTHTVVVNQSSH